MIRTPEQQAKFERYVSRRSGAGLSEEERQEWDELKADWDRLDVETSQIKHALWEIQNDREDAAECLEDFYDR